MTADNDDEDDDDDNGNGDDDKNSGLSSCWSSPDGNSGGQDHSGTPPHIFQMMIMMMIRKIFFMVITIMWTIIPTQTIYLTQWTLMKMDFGWTSAQDSALRGSCPSKLSSVTILYSFQQNLPKPSQVCVTNRLPLLGSSSILVDVILDDKYLVEKKYFEIFRIHLYIFYRNYQNAQFFLRSEWMIRRI